MVIYITRHCRTEWNSELRIQGTKNLPLSDEGRKEAQQNLVNIESLSINQIISSDYLRAYQTAKIYADFLKVPLDTHAGLRELDHGNWEGQRIPELIEDQNSGYKQWLANPQSVVIPGGAETVSSAQQRIVRAVKEIALKYKDERILIVTHKHIRALYFLALKGLDFSHFATQVKDDIKPVEIKVNYE